MTDTNNAVIEFTPSEEQAKAIDLCLDRSKRIVAITGPAGSGKTTIIRKIGEAFDAQGISYALAAPTGKAAKRIKEATGIHAVTIHKLLEYSRPGDRDEKTGKPLTDSAPKRDHQNPLAQRVIIVDEYTMVNHEINRNLIDAMGKGAVLRVFGDINQLPPIESHDLKNVDNSPFEDHLARKDVVTLDKVFRQGEDSGILAAANRIRKGIMPIRSADFVLKFTDEPVKIVEQYAREMLADGVSFGDIRNQFLTPTRVRWIGTYELNLVLRNVFNPTPKDEMILPRHKWEEKNVVTVGIGDKVVCNTNTYDMRDYHTRFTQWEDNGDPVMQSFIPTPENKTMLNGETGLVIDVHMDGGMEIDFGDRVVEVPGSYEEYWAQKGIIIENVPSKNIELAYALTTHKAQGSEYDHIAYVMNNSIYYMLTRENLYTAVTRAKKGVTLITDQRALQTALKKNERMRKLAQKQKNSGKKLVG